MTVRAAQSQLHMTSPHASPPPPPAPSTPPHTGALPIKAPCSNSSQCASGLCADSRCCWDWLRGNGAACTSNQQCCSNTCADNGKCEPQRVAWALACGMACVTRSQPTHTYHLTPACACAPRCACRGAGCSSLAGYKCAADADCCDGGSCNALGLCQPGGGPSERAATWMHAAVITLPAATTTTVDACCLLLPPLLPLLLLLLRSASGSLHPARRGSLHKCDSMLQRPVRTRQYWGTDSAQHVVCACIRGLVPGAGGVSHHLHVWPLARNPPTPGTRARALTRGVCACRLRQRAQAARAAVRPQLKRSRLLLGPMLFFPPQSPSL
jgi:hypothetical protein